MLSNLRNGAISEITESYRRGCWGDPICLSKKKVLPVIHRHIDLINVPMLSREYFYDIKLVSGFSSDCPNDWIVTRLLNPIA